MWCARTAALAHAHALRAAVRVPLRVSLAVFRRLPRRVSRDSLTGQRASTSLASSLPRYVCVHVHGRHAHGQSAPTSSRPRSRSHRPIRASHAAHTRPDAESGTCMLTLACAQSQSISVGLRGHSTRLPPRYLMSPFHTPHPMAGRGCPVVPQPADHLPGDLCHRRCGILRDGRGLRRCASWRGSPRR